jgi:hypothetical protein
MTSNLKLIRMKKKNPGILTPTNLKTDQRLQNKKEPNTNLEIPSHCSLIQITIELQN